jgi:hypothetical protein
LVERAVVCQRPEVKNVTVTAAVSVFPNELYRARAQRQEPDIFTIKVRAASKSLR